MKQLREQTNLQEQRPAEQPVKKQTQEKHLLSGVKNLVPAKEDSQSITVYYLPKVLECGPLDGSSPLPAAQPVLSVILPVSARTHLLEKRLLAHRY